MSRRELLSRLSRSALGVPSLAFLSRVGLAAEAAGDARDLALMIRELVPHDGLDERFYFDMAEAVLRRAEATAQLERLRAGLARLDDHAGPGGWLDAAPSRRADVLERVQSDSFFGLVRNAAIEAVYRDPRAWELVGYGGNALAQGGYLRRGFDDIDWLPE